MGPRSSIFAKATVRITVPSMAKTGSLLCSIGKILIIAARVELGMRRDISLLEYIRDNYNPHPENSLTALIQRLMAVQNAKNFTPHWLG
jgi:hypothetical protein